MMINRVQANHLINSIKKYFLDLDIFNCRNEFLKNLSEEDLKYYYEILVDTRVGGGDIFIRININMLNEVSKSRWIYGDVFTEKFYVDSKQFHEYIKSAHGIYFRLTIMLY